jgi:hypothetical protein
MSSRHMSSVTSHIHNNMFTAPGFSNRFLVESDLFISYLLCSVVFLFVLLCLVFFSFFFLCFCLFFFFLMSVVFCFRSVCCSQFCLYLSIVNSCLVLSVLSNAYFHCCSGISLTNVIGIWSADAYD